MNECFATFYESIYFAYLNNENKIAFIPTFSDSSKETKEVNVSAFLNKQSPYHSIVFKDNKIFSLDEERYKFYRINVDSNFSITSVDSFSFANISSKYGFYTNITQQFQVIDTVCFLPFYLKKEHNSEKFAYLKVNLNNIHALDKVVRRPKEYLNEERHNGAFYLFKNSANKINIFYSQIDKIDSYNIEATELLDETIFNESSGFLSYDKSKNMNLAYLNLYSERNESNEKVIELKDRFLIIKKLGRLNKREQLNYEYIVLDSNFNKLYYNLFTVPILPQYVFPYKKGFIVLGVNAPNAYYYEVL